MIYTPADVLAYAKSIGITSPTIGQRIEIVKLMLQAELVSSTITYQQESLNLQVMDLRLKDVQLSWGRNRVAGIVTIPDPIFPTLLADHGLPPAPPPVIIPPPTLSIVALAASKLEGNTGSTPFTFQIDRYGDGRLPAQVDGTVSGLSTADFSGGAFPSGTTFFAPGEIHKSITILVAGDILCEPNETFTVTLSNATPGAVIATASATGTILNDDVAPTPVDTGVGN